MPFVPGQLVAEVNINQLLYGERVQNTLYCLNFGGWTPAGLQVLAGEMITWVGTQLYPSLSNALSLTEVFVRDLTVADGPQFTGVPTVPVLGGQAGSALPGNCAVVASFRTGLTGRSRRGRNYVAGITELEANQNLISPALRNSIQAAYDNLLAPSGPFGASGAAWVVFSRIALGVERVNGLPTFVSAVLVDNRIDSQRRRLAGRGT